MAGFFRGRSRSSVLLVLRLEIDILNISRDNSILVYFVLLRLLSTFLHVGRVQISNIFRLLLTHFPLIILYETVLLSKR